MVVQCSECGRLQDVPEWSSDLRCACSPLHLTLRLIDIKRNLPLVEKALATAAGATVPLTQSAPRATDYESDSHETQHFETEHHESDRPQSEPRQSEPRQIEPYESGHYESEAGPASVRGMRTHSVISALGLDSHSSSSGAEAQGEREKYDYLQSLGSGGMGDVVRAFDRDLQRFVAIKLLRPEIGTREGILRFVKEAQVTGRLEHPNIVPVHDLGVDSEGRVYFSLKLIDGESLGKVIEKRKSSGEIAPGLRYKDVYTPLRMTEVFISVCQAVAYAHAKGIVHRDLKPDNVMLGRYGEVLVVDWGIAKVLEGDSDAPGETTQAATETLPVGAMNVPAPEKSMEGQISGTPAYMSPEQAEGRISSIDIRSDVYSLGALSPGIRPPAVPGKR